MRSFQTVEAHEDACVVMGYAATYEPYPLFLAADGVEWRERIAPDAFAGTDLSDVIFQYDHAGRIYARTTNGSLETVPDGRGLRIWADLSLTDGSRACMRTSVRGSSRRCRSPSWSIGTTSRRMDISASSTISGGSMT